MSDVSPETGRSFPKLAGETFRHYAADLHRYLRKRLRDPQKAEDVSQEIFSRLLRVRRPELVKKPHAYLYGIAFHVIRELRLQEDKDPVSFDSPAIEHASEHPRDLAPDELPDQLNMRTQLEQALLQLPEIHRALILMCKRDGMTYEEAAAATGISAHMVEKHLGRARAKLLNMMWDL